jgi:hypothetical protein
MAASEIYEPAHLNADAAYGGLRSDEDGAQSVELRTRCNERAFGHCCIGGSP